MPLICQVAPADGSERRVFSLRRQGSRVARFLAVCLHALVFALYSSSTSAADITVSGVWSAAIGTSDLLAGAGSNLTVIESGTGALALSISNTSGRAWAVKGHRSFSAWSASAGLAFRRTSAGRGCAAISGGTGYLTLDGTDQTLFSGTGDCSGIAIQLKLDGASVQMAPGSYAGSAVYTVQ